MILTIFRSLCLRLVTVGEELTSHCSITISPSLVSYECCSLLAYLFSAVIGTLVFVVIRDVRFNE